MSTTVTFTEAAIGDGFRLDAEAGIAYGVAVCGPVSANGRDYPDAVRDRDKGLYDGSQVYIDHKDGERHVREWFGELRNPRTRVSDRRTIADHHYPKNSSFTAEYEERAAKFPRSLGFSHVAVCRTKRVNGREVIEAIQRVESVDLVARPATNSSLFESTTPEVRPMKLGKFIEAVTAKFPAVADKLKVIREMDGMDEMDMPADMPPPEDATSMDDPVKAAFSQAMHALVDQLDGGMDPGEFLTKLKTLMKAAEKMAGKEAEPEPVEPADGPDMEGVKKQLADAIKEVQALKLDRLFAESGVTPTEPERKAVGLLTDEADRKALVESLKRGRGTEAPKSPARPVSESKQDRTAVPTDGKAFAEFIR